MRLQELDQQVLGIDVVFHEQNLLRAAGPRRRRIRTITSGGLLLVHRIAILRQLHFLRK